jgi:hypothetical protein
LTGKGQCDLNRKEGINAEPKNAEEIEMIKTR